MTRPITEKARQALARAQVLYLNDPNVALIDLGFRIDAGSNRIGPELAVRFHVYEKYTGAAFATFSDLYPHRVIRSEYIDFPVVVMPTFYQIQRYDQAFRLCPNPGWFFPFLCGGMAIRCQDSHGFNTLGGLVQDRETGADLIMTSWHGLFESGQPEQQILYQTGRSEIAEALSAIGVYFKDAMDFHMDVAVARAFPMRSVKNDQLGIGMVTGLGEPVPGMTVIKSGARTGVTHGLVTGVLGSSMRFCRGQRRLFTNLIHIMTQECDVRLSDQGDSGAWWLEAASRRAVAVHFAGSQNPDYALAFAMPKVLTALNVELAVRSQIRVRIPHLYDSRPAGVPIEIADPYRAIVPIADDTDCTDSDDYAINSCQSDRSIAWQSGLSDSRSEKLEHQVSARWSGYAVACLSILVIFLVLGIHLAIQIRFSEQQSRLTAIEQGLNTLEHMAIIDHEYRSETQEICSIIEMYNPAMSDSQRVRIAREIYSMSKQYSRLDVELLCATITHETGRTWDPKVVSPAGAIGLMQIMPLTGSYLAGQAGLPDGDISALLCDPICNIRLGCRYLAFLIDAYGVDGGLAAYNGGMARAEAWLRNGKVEGILYAETALYVPAILRIYYKLKYQKNS